ncbi:MAG: MAPEG family protein [Proteobacteria bacterium]|nr:MAPEG family protein [Pseudomonadota bacterium]
MTIKMILLPVFVQVTLTLAVLIWMARSRVAAVKGKAVRVGDVALGQLNWPPRVQQISNNYHSQLQLPVLFYVLTVLAIITRQADLLFVVLAWLFVVSRLIHCYIHTTSNFMLYRFYAFATGMVILLAMWLIFAVKIILATP